MATQTLKLITDELGPDEDPPRPLGPHGMALWRSILAQYQIDDAAGREYLLTACQALDRAEALKSRIDEDGPVIRMENGSLRDHPALKHETAARSLCIRTLARLGLDLQPLQPGPGRPAGGGYYGD